MTVAEHSMCSFTSGICEKGVAFVRDDISSRGVARTTERKVEAR